MAVLHAIKERNLLINRDFALLLCGEAVSSIGDFVFNTTLILWIAIVIAPGKAWAPLAVGGVALAASVPTLVVGPVAGVFVDRWDKRATMLRMDVLRAILIATLLIAARGGLPVAWQLGMIYGVVALASACSRFFDPSILVLVGDIVPAAERARAGAMTEVATNLAMMIGPPLAAPLLFSVGVQWAIIVDALSFVASFLALRALHLAPAAPVEPGPETAAGAGNRFLRDFGAGLRFFASNGVLMTLLSTLMIVVIGGGALTTLNVFFLIDDLHTPDSLFGLLGLVSAVGGIAGALLTGLLASHVGPVRCYWFALLMGGISLLVYAQLTSFGPALVVLAVLGLVDSVPEVALGPILLQATPREFLGRVSAVLQPSLSATRMISVTLVGFLASSALRGMHAHVLTFNFDAVTTIFSGAGILILIAGVYAMVSLHGVVVRPADAEAGEMA
jgi:MFS family permease